MLDAYLYYIIILPTTTSDSVTAGRFYGLIKADDACTPNYVN